MALQIIWSHRAITNFERIVKFIGDKWTDREVENFIQKTEQVLSGLRSHPKMFKVSKKKGIRKGLITNHTSNRKKGN